MKNLKATSVEHILNIIKLIPMYLFAVILLFLIGYLELFRFPEPLYFFLFLYTVIAYFIRYYATKILPYFLLHLWLALIPLIFLPSFGMKVYSLIYIFFLFIYAYQYWQSDDIGVAVLMKPIMVLVGFGAYVVAIGSKDHYYPDNIFMMTILYLLFSNIGTCITRTEAYIKENNENDKASLNRVIRKNTQIVSLLLLFIFLVAFLCNSSFVQDIFQNIYNVVWSWIKKFLGNFSVGIDLSKKEIKPSLEPDDFTATDGTFALPAWLYQLFTTLSMFLFSMIPVIIIFMVVHFVFSIRSKKEQKEMEDLDDIEEIRTKLKNPKKTSPRSSIFRKEPGHAVRRKYYKTIRDYQKQGYDIKDTHTPEERKEDIKKTYQNDISILTTEYEKARYGK